MDKVVGRGRPPGERVEVVCVNCGKNLVRRKTDMERNTSGRVFCDATCLRALGAKPRRGEAVVCTREGCDTKFYRGPNSRQRYCSRDCKDSGSRVERETHVCRHCGAEFQVVPGVAKYNSNAFCSWEHFQAWREEEARSTRKRTSDGYVSIYRPESPSAQPSTGRVMEHRWVMEGLLGRQLVEGENVHHINGERADNSTDGPLRMEGGKLRSGNLELWNTSQPAGKRPEDMVVFARKILGLYGSEEQRERYAAYAPPVVPVPAIEPGVAR